MSAPSRAPRAHKEAFFVQVKNAEEKLVFFDASDQLGKPMPYTRPEATCALRVSESMVVFSLLKMSNRTRQNLADTRLEMPRGPLSKLERRLGSLTELPDTQLAVEIGSDTHLLTMSRDENGVVTLATPADTEEVSFELPKSAVQLAVYLKSPKTGRLVAASFIGHLGKPGTVETVSRAVAFALNHFAGLPVFRLVCGIETVAVPAAPSRWLAQKVTRTPGGEVVHTVPVRLWSDAAAPVMLAADMLRVQVDLQTANPATGRLLFHITPGEALVGGFDAYKGIAEKALADSITNDLGPDDVEEIVLNIALGELNEKDVERLREALQSVTGLDLSPRMWVPFVPVVA